jgi:hypothetical protein
MEAMEGGAVGGLRWFWNHREHVFRLWLIDVDELLDQGKTQCIGSN